MSSKMWQTLSSSLKNLRLTTSLQKRFLEVQAATPASSPGNQKPKRPLTPYFRFMAKVRGDLAKQNPKMPNRELLKLIGQKWAKLDAASKEHYSVAFKEELGPFTLQMAKYNETVTPQAREQEEQSKLERQVKKEKRQHRKRIQDLGKPTKPATPFLQFVKSKFTTVPGGGRANTTAQTRELSTAWKTISEADKAPFILKYEKDAEVYHKALAKWEDEMLKLGNDDVVRQDRLRPHRKSKSNSDLAPAPDTPRRSKSASGSGSSSA